jgi:hypothetical protein
MENSKHSYYLKIKRARRAELFRRAFELERVETTAGVPEEAVGAAVEAAGLSSVNEDVVGCEPDLEGFEGEYELGREVEAVSVACENASWDSGCEEVEVDLRLVPMALDVEELQHVTSLQERFVFPGFCGGKGRRLDGWLEGCD